MLLEKNQGTPTREKFEKLVSQHSGPPIRSNALGKLTQFRRETIVMDYQTRFLALINCYKRLSKPHQINIFTASLRDPLKTNVELEQPMTLEDPYDPVRPWHWRMRMNRGWPWWPINRHT
jgi:hypothetical protein